MKAWEYMQKQYREKGWIFFKPSEIYELMDEKEAKKELNELVRAGKIRKRTGETVLIEITDELR